MPKRGENIRKRKDGRWEARYEKGRKGDGRIQYGYLYGKTYQEAKMKKFLAMQQYQIQPEDKNEMTMEFLCQEWKKATRYTVKESSYACYDTLLEIHILPWFGNYYLFEINTNVICSFALSKQESGLAPRTIKSLLILLQNILRFGEERRYLSLDNLQIRYPRVSEQSALAICDADIQKLISVLTGTNTNFAAGILLMIYTGIRVGELAGLQWGDINFQEGTIKISRTVSRIKNINDSDDLQNHPKTRLVITPPKSSSSLRDIPVPESLLKKMQKLQAGPSDFLLTGEKKCMEPRCIQRRFHTLLKQCGLPPANIHSLRHAFATRCTEIGFDSKTLSEILGHSSTKITMDLYVHSNMRQKRNCMNQFFY